MGRAKGQKVESNKQRKRKEAGGSRAETAGPGESGRRGEGRGQAGGGWERRPRVSRARQVVLPTVPTPQNYRRGRTSHVYNPGTWKTDRQHILERGGGRG